MKTDDLDIVYCCKNSINNEELRYSLRSLINMPHKNVWIYGGCPHWARHIRHVPMLQGGTKWWNTANMLNEISQNQELSRNFIWFNDDFFVLKPCDKIEYWREGTLTERADRTISAKGRLSNYGKNLLEAAYYLNGEGKKQRSFELHLPIIFNKNRLRRICLKYRGTPIRRSIYCNEYGIVGVPHKDVKIEDYTSPIPRNSTFVSTSDTSFSSGLVGKQIRERFSKKGPYEAQYEGESFVEIGRAYV